VKYRPSGAMEIRVAGNAFLDMRKRIERQNVQRTVMLSGVSHDLRTPLTRLKLGLSMLDCEEEAIEALSADVDDIEKMLDEFLTFAKGDAFDNPTEIDPVKVLQSVVEKFAGSGEPVTLVSAIGQGTILSRSESVTRVIENLIGNALRYGRKCHVSVRVLENSVRMTIEDDGPGIRPEFRKEAVKPFVRLDNARNQNSGSGVGLGLAIAKDIVERHGGTLKLGDSEALGGLRVDLIFPR
jgi:two-component system, OmpR family, osmolarity sensor histidine kinase EnvZ